MKKLLFFLLLVTTLFSFTGCDDIATNDDFSSPDSQNEESEEKEERPVKRTEDISSGISKDLSRFSYSYDFDFDETEENIELSMIRDPEGWVTSLEVCVGDEIITVDAYDAAIVAVYACDIDQTDDTRDLAVITSEVSSDIRIRIFNYGEGLTPYDFSLYDHWEEEVCTDDSNWLGYPINYNFCVNNDDTITIEEQTGSYGMWSVSRTYEQNANGAFEEIVPHHYEILPDFMEESYFYTSGEMTGKERDMWEKGYIKAYADFESDTISILTDDYFKVIADNDQNGLLIEKEDGTTGWITIDYNMYDINPYFFYLAG